MFPRPIFQHIGLVIPKVLLSQIDSVNVYTGVNFDKEVMISASDPSDNDDMELKESERLKARFDPCISHTFKMRVSSNASNGSKEFLHQIFRHKPTKFSEVSKQKTRTCK